MTTLYSDNQQEIFPIVDMEGAVIGQATRGECHSGSLTPFFPASYEPELLARMPQCVSGRWHPEFTDITANGADKGKGILAIARHEGFDPSRTMAFGDGGNATSMILQAGIGQTIEIIEFLFTAGYEQNGLHSAARFVFFYAFKCIYPISSPSIQGFICNFTPEKGRKSTVYV